MIIGIPYLEALIKNSIVFISYKTGQLNQPSELQHRLVFFGQNVVYFLIFLKLKTQLWYVKAIEDRFKLFFIKIFHQPPSHQRGS